MPLAEPPAASAKQISANRRNALKSTGPRTEEGKARVALNAFKHGRYAASQTQLRHALMAKQGEDPGDYEALQRGLSEAWAPANAMEALLVQDLTDLFWQKGCAQRARETAQLQAMEEKEAQRELSELDDRRWKDDDSVSWSGTGYCGAQNCPEKFEKVYERLDRLADWVARRDGSRDPKPVFEELYDSYPTRLGDQIIKLYDLCRRKHKPPEDKTWQELQRLIAAERQDVEREQELYRRAQKRCISFPDDAALAQQAALDRQIEVRLLVHLQSRRPRGAVQEDDPPSAFLPSVDEPIGNTHGLDTAPATLEPASTAGVENEEQSH